MASSTRRPRAEPRQTRLPLTQLPESPAKTQSVKGSKVEWWRQGQFTKAPLNSADEDEDGDEQGEYVMDAARELPTRAKTSRLMQPQKARSNEMEKRRRARAKQTQGKLDFGNHTGSALGSDKAARQIGRNSGRGANNGYKFGGMASSVAGLDCSEDEAEEDRPVAPHSAIKRKGKVVEFPSPLKRKFESDGEDDEGPLFVPLKTQRGLRSKASVGDDENLEAPRPARRASRREDSVAPRPARRSSRREASKVAIVISDDEEAVGDDDFDAVSNDESLRKNDGLEAFSYYESSGDDQMPHSSPHRKSGKGRATPSAHAHALRYKSDGFVVDDDEVSGNGDGDEEAVPVKAKTQSTRKEKAKKNQPQKPTKRARIIEDEYDQEDGFVVQDDEVDEEDELPARKQKHPRRHNAAPADSNSSDNESPTKKDRLIRRRKLNARKSRREEEDLEEDLEFLSSQKHAQSTPRLRSSGTTRKQSTRETNLENFKAFCARVAGEEWKGDESPRQTRRGRALYDSDSAEESLPDPDEDDDEEGLDENDEDDSANQVDARELFNENEHDKDFVVSDGEDDLLGVPEMPLQFTNLARAKGKDLFKFAVESMVMKRLNPGYEGCEEYELAFRKLNDEVQTLAGSKFTSSIWKGEFLSSLKHRPRISVSHVASDGMQHCMACDRKRHLATYELTFTGKPYDRDTLEEFIYEDDEDGDGESNSPSSSTSSDKPEYDDLGQAIPSAGVVYHCGQTCAMNAQSAHKLEHWRFHINELVVHYLREQGYLEPDEIVKRDGMKAKKRYRLAKKVANEMEVKGEVRRLYENYKREIVDAHVARGSGQQASAYVAASISASISASLSVSNLRPATSDIPTSNIPTPSLPPPTTHHHLVCHWHATIAPALQFPPSHSHSLSLLSLSLSSLLQSSLRLTRRDATRPETTHPEPARRHVAPRAKLTPPAQLSRLPTVQSSTPPSTSNEPHDTIDIPQPTAIFINPSLRPPNPPYIPYSAASTSSGNPESVINFPRTPTPRESRLPFRPRSASIDEPRSRPRPPKYSLHTVRIGEPYTPRPRASSTSSAHPTSLYRLQTHPALRISRGRAVAINWSLEAIIRGPKHFTRVLEEELEELMVDLPGNGGRVAASNTKPQPMPESARTGGTGSPAGMRTPRTIMAERQLRVDAAKRQEEDARRATVTAQQQQASSAHRRQQSYQGQAQRIDAGDAGYGARLQEQSMAPLPPLPQPPPIPLQSARRGTNTQSRGDPIPVQQHQSAAGPSQPPLRQSQSQQQQPPPQQTQQTRAGPSQQVRSGQSSFPHAFERWEELSSHWEGLTSFWIHKLEIDAEEVSRVPLGQQMNRQITDLAAAGANLFHAVVELQRLRASSERKFQRWYSESRVEIETYQEQIAKLDQLLREEKIKSRGGLAQQIEQARLKAEMLADEAKRELAISKDEAKRAWEELGRREQQERERVQSLREGVPILIGGVQVFPTMAAASGQPSLSQRGPDGGGGNVSGIQYAERAAYPAVGGYGEGIGPTDTNPFTDRGQQSHYPSGVTPATNTVSQGTSIPSPLQHLQQSQAYFLLQAQQIASRLQQHARGNAFYQQLHPSTYALGPGLATGISVAEARGLASYIPTAASSGVGDYDADFSSEDEVGDFESDEDGNLRCDSTGLPIVRRRGLRLLTMDGADDDEMDVGADVERERELSRQYGAVSSTQKQQRYPFTTPSMRAAMAAGQAVTAGAVGGRSALAPQQQQQQQQHDPPRQQGVPQQNPQLLSPEAPMPPRPQQAQTRAGSEGEGYDKHEESEQWDTMRHHHPTRLSDVIEEDERSRRSVD